MSWPALGRDPAPGDVGAVNRLASSFGTVADRSEDLLGVLRRVDGDAGPGVWRGPAAEDFRRLLADVGPGLMTLSGSYRAAQQSAAAYATALAAAQDLARRAEADAQHALADRSAAEGRRRSASADVGTHAASRRAAQLRVAEAQALRLTTAFITDPGYASSVVAYEQQMRNRYTHAQNAEAEARRRERTEDDAVEAAAQRVGRARRLADDATDDHGRAKDRFVRALREAGDASGVRPDLVQRVWREMQRSVSVKLGLQGELGDKSWKAVEKYFRDHKLDPDDAREFFTLLQVSSEGSAAYWEREASGKNGWGEGSAGIQAGGVEGKAEAGIGLFDDGSYGAAVGAAGSVYALRGQAQGRVGNDRFGLEGKVNGQVGARGKLGADVGFSKDKVRATAGGEFHLGAEAGGELGVDLAGVKPTVGVTGQAGIGGAANLDVGYSKGKFKIDGELGLVIGLGGKVSGGVEIDVPKIADNLGDAGKGAFGFAKKSIGSIPTPW